MKKWNLSVLDLGSWGVDALNIANKFSSTRQILNTKASKKYYQSTSTGSHQVPKGRPLPVHSLF
jgi:hypothetical protein